MANTNTESMDDLACDSIRHFKENLNNLRLLDDKIVYELNKSNPTSSFQHEVNAEKMCQSLYNELLELHKFRAHAIHNCIQKKSVAIDILNNQTTENNIKSDQKELKSLQSSIRLLQSELIVEDVVKNRSLKIFNEKCWKSFPLPDKSSS